MDDAVTDPRPAHEDPAADDLRGDALRISNMLDALQAVVRAQGVTPAVRRVWMAELRRAVALLERCLATTTAAAAARPTPLAAGGADPATVTVDCPAGALWKAAAVAASLRSRHPCCADSPHSVVADRASLRALATASPMVLRWIGEVGLQLVRDHNPRTWADVRRWALASAPPPPGGVLPPADYDDRPLPVELTVVRPRLVAGER